MNKIIITPWFILILSLCFALSACSSRKMTNDRPYSMEHGTTRADMHSPSSSNAMGEAHMRQPLSQSEKRQRDERSGRSDKGPDRTLYNNSGYSYWNRTDNNSLATFGLDVSTASYGLARSKIMAGSLPPPEAVRIEEMINYFSFNPGEVQLKRLGSSPFSAAYELAQSPWGNTAILMIHVKSETPQRTQRQNPNQADSAAPVNLVCAVDVSAGMKAKDRLPLVKAALRLLASRLRVQDSMAIVTFGDRVRQSLPPTTGAAREYIEMAIDELTPTGASAGARGLQEAYSVAADAAKPGGSNKVILFTDGDFNLGPADVQSMSRLMAFTRPKGISLTIAGVGSGHYNDNLLSNLALEGGGTYHFLPDAGTALKLFLTDAGQTLESAAMDIKAQIEFNPAVVSSWKQIGYEKTALASGDFSNDSVGAGSIGKDSSVTILFELQLSGMAVNQPNLRYQPEKNKKPASGEPAFLKLRWKNPEGRRGEGLSREVSLPIVLKGGLKNFESASPVFRFTSAVAEFAIALKYKTNANYNSLISRVQNAAGASSERMEFARLLTQAQNIK